MHISPNIYFVRMLLFRGPCVMARCNQCAQDIFNSYEGLSKKEHSGKVEVRGNVHEKA